MNNITTLNVKVRGLTTYPTVNSAYIHRLHLLFYRYNFKTTSYLGMLEYGSMLYRAYRDKKTLYEFRSPANNTPECFYSYGTICI